ncbi:sensor histidine kinase [Saccharothrix sp. NRRL B-16348]|uniref:sensor histidine kinase n=1 Tax=Saccharothrix sp. NRRL B-16348 TaxID=1415542 RepID=UPI0006B04BDF|nr:HAMP domain-containing sensor histidine kinase [Saccharothrix sp. NRRL B-16348]
MRVRVTLLAAVAIGAPLLALAAGAGVFLHSQATRPDTAPKMYSICIEASVLARPPRPQQPPDPHASDLVRLASRCEGGSSEIEITSARMGDVLVVGATDADKVVSAKAHYLSQAWVAELSLWPFTDPAGIDYHPVSDNGRIGPSRPVSQLLHLGDDLVDAQRTINRQVLVLAVGWLALVGIIASVVWLAMGRVLRPVEAIRREMADITEHDLTRRVPVSHARNEITLLASTVNATLDRLQHAVDENRRFVADASHELRSPITALRTGLEIATAHPSMTDWPAVVDAALADTERLQHLATDLLLLARLDHVPTMTGHDTAVDLTHLVREHAVRRRSEHILTATLPHRPALVHGSRALLERLLGNLLDNAERHATTSIAVHLDTTDRHAILEVVDDGPGIPPEDRDRVFDRFTRLDDARARDSGGAGLGLAIARRIATAHAGTLHATNHPTGGARLVATLPLAL